MNPSTPTPDPAETPAGNATLEGFDAPPEQPSLAECVDSGPLATPEEWLRLVLTPGLGPVRLARLLAQCGGPGPLLAATTAGLAAHGIHDRQAIAALTAPPTAETERWRAAAWHWAKADGHHLIPLDHPAYPPGLLELADPPALLFVDGDPEALAWPGVALVGTRKPSPAGDEAAVALGAGLARAGLSVVSGLALGIDAAAHRGALEAGGPTVAVLGCGPDRIYPSRHTRLAAAIRENGAVISELPPGTVPTRHQFPRRNRIIAGMTLGTVVVEAALRSGSLITARLALEAGREVMALPGPVRSPGSRGCHQLIRDGARLVEGVSDILEEVAPGIRVPEVAADQGGTAGHGPGRPEEARIVLDVLGNEPETVDNVVERCALTAETVSSMLILLELEGAVASAPGGRYCRATKRPN